MHKAVLSSLNVLFKHYKGPFVKGLYFGNCYYELYKDTQLKIKDYNRLMKATRRQMYQEYKLKNIK